MGNNEATSGSASAAPPLRMGLRINLSIMMFLQFAVWGAWFVVLGNYIGAMGFENIGRYYATMSLGAIISPIFVGQIADRYFSSERLMAFLHLAGAGLLYWMAQLTQPEPFYWAALVYSLVYSPTLALSNSIAFSHIPDATRDFPGLRVLGTIGWIVSGFLVTFLLSLFGNSPAVAGLPAAEFSVMVGGMRMTLPLLLAAVLSLVLGIMSLALPHTPPPGKAGDALPFLRALGLMKEFSFAVFYGVSFIITIVLAFYYAWTPYFLEHAQKVEGKAVSSYMIIGQVAETILLPLLPIFLRKMGMKWVLALGMLAWGVRYLLFALVGAQIGTLFFAMALVGVALHGICFDFFFAAGFIHVDNKAPQQIRASAQALFGFLTYGLGMYLGSELSDMIAKCYGITPGQAEFGEFARKIKEFLVGMIHGDRGQPDWFGFWMVPSIGVLVSLAIFAILFRDRSKNETSKAG